MFFITYLRRELRRRTRQAVLIAVGLAVGVGVVVTVAAASAGVKKAQSGVLGALYGVGTDVTVTGPAEAPPPPGTQSSKSGQTLRIGPSGPEICTNGTCVSAAGHTVDQLFPPLIGPISASKVAAVARLHDVAAAAGAIALIDNSLTIPKNSGASQETSVSFTVDGVDTEHTALGPLAAATIRSGHSLTAADAEADVAVVDSSYAISKGLKTGSTITIRQVRFTVIGIAAQPQSTSPPDVYIPLARAQAIASASKAGGSLAGDVTLIYVAAASAADVPTVQHEVSRLLPRDTVTAASSLAGEVTGSLSAAARLANELGTWVSVLALIAAFALAGLLALAGVTRRSAEFGTLKSLGWRTRRIISQVLGESVVVGIVGAVAGVGLGFAGAAIIARVAPTLSAAVASQGSGLPQTTRNAAGVPYHAVLVPLSPSITIGVIVLAVTLALAGGLLAGAVGAWRIARMRPADALAAVA
jgi:putative ABC transport system permease protein